MKYDPIEEERNWYRRGEIGCREPGPLPAKHHFAHNCVRQKLYETVAAWGFDNNSLMLELGCGSGEDATRIQETSRNIIGVDISDVALRRFKDKGFQGVLANVKALPFRNNSFDCVIASGLLHHLIGQGNLPEYLSEFCRVTKKRGYVIALEPNIFHPSGVLMNIFNKLKPGITGLVPHERALSPLYLARVFERAGLKGVKYASASYVWNRFPLPISQFISKHENKIRTKRPCNLFGWFEIVYGQNANLQEIAR